MGLVPSHPGDHILANRTKTRGMGLVPSRPGDHMLRPTETDIRATYSNRKFFSFEASTYVKPRDM